VTYFIFYDSGKREGKLLEDNCTDQELDLSVAKASPPSSYAITGEEQSVPRIKFVTASL